MDMLMVDKLEYSSRKDYLYEIKEGLQSVTNDILS